MDRGPLVRPCARRLPRPGSRGSPSLHRCRGGRHHHQQLLRHPGSPCSAMAWAHTSKTGNRRSARMAPGGARPVLACGISRRGGIGQQLRPVRPTGPGDDVRPLPCSGRDTGRRRRRPADPRDTGVHGPHHQGDGECDGGTWACPCGCRISCARDRDTGAVMLGIEESREATHIAETYGPLAGGGAGDRGRRRFGRPHDALGPGCDRGRRQGSCARTGRGPVGAYPNAGVLDTAELGLRRSGFAGRVPGRRPGAGSRREPRSWAAAAAWESSTYAPSRKDWGFREPRRDAGRVPSHV